MVDSIRQGGKAYAWHLPLMGLFIGLLWAGIGFNLWRDFESAKHNAIKDAETLARAFSEDVTRTIEAVDQTLLRIRQVYQAERTGFLQNSWIKGPALLDEPHVRMSLSNRDGEVLWSDVDPPATNVNIADRAQFQAQKASNADNLLISKPVIGRVSGQWSVDFVRKLLAPDGSFDGVAVVSIDPRALSRFLGSVVLENGSVVLATVEGIVLARAPGPVPPDGLLPPATKLRIMQSAMEGGLRAVSSIDHVDRIISGRRLERWPLVVAVGLASETAFATYERSKALYFGAGILLSFASIAVGVVILRQARSLLDSRQALAATLENMSQGIAMILADGSISVISQRAITLLGLPPDLMAGKPKFQQIINWQFANQEFGEPVNLDNSVVRTKGGLHATDTYERTRPNGTVLEIRTEGLPGGGIVRTFTDVTERKKNEAALAAAQARAAHAERMQALGQLAGGIAHDFNNILQVVQGAAGLIDKRAAELAGVRRFARIILDATERGTSITRRLLTFARRGELRAEPVDPAEVTTGLRDVLSHTLAGAITIEVRLATGLPPMLVDRSQLETALVNMATNARDAMPHGGTLTFNAATVVVEQNEKHPADLRPGRYVLLSVADTGTGIDEALLAQVLEPFFTTRPAGQGTGLGLSMAKGVLEQSGGGLIIASVPGFGTTVNFWLPAAVQTESPPAPKAPARNGTGKHILLVDDEAMIRETLAATLGDAGYIVLVASDGTEALKLLRSPTEVVDVVVTDLSMPGIDGLAVIRQAQRYRPDVPAVLLTGFVGDGAHQAVGGSLNGRFSLLRKPVTAAQLADRIDALLAVGDSA